MSDWIEGTVHERINWTRTHFSLRVSADLPPYQAGQFTKLALQAGEQRIQRAYSFVNPPNSPWHEFYIVEIPEGALTPRLGELEVGDKLLIAANPAGFLTLDEIPAGRDLWMLSTGTAIGPFLSILAQGDVATRFDNLVLVHGVRFGAELTYQPLIRSFAEQWGDRFHYVPMVTRETWGIALGGRIPSAIEKGTLEQKVGLSISAENSQVMICGNPEMVRDTQAILLARGLAKNLRRKPGQITAEHYW